ncbi:bifunctional 2-C-methyl-D-erythritol 4-phosphate cytidylyltransferase/2-C-methyl-D-erythritol 2,4-cyclodiphosphate synthase [Algihabitans albus]|uniref:bifunctional 2-C-methyl-D-erythritol 4-phosphate cytidylyltransferase/2-C-methyl-D-erythritol 2,4-cyclodiphosphate synthase n=1 Tax=Algihabitans albus TaxID=2164067 RepID=UPI000E5D431C|nr:bifunctional 2-C-methyl-D-erythritol 4-phosphate cytidylyltransferase/2-C-methyl-D-erythritol 2,4-cyclodiphosphate synthase [Algihabitans albus]
MSGKTAAIVVAAGRGSRFGGGPPKQYTPLAGRPILTHALARLAAHPRIGAVRAVIHPEDETAYAEAAAGLDLMPPVHGGADRQESVRHGLESLHEENPSNILIHDAARPLLEADVVERLLSALEQAPGALPVLPVADTLKRGAGARVVETVPRTDLYRAQTPQAFHFQAILAAHRAAAGRQLTDDAAVAEAAGLPVALVEGSPKLLKITTAADLSEAESWLRPGLSAQPPAGEVRVGQGFDVHRFGPGEAVILCGLRIPHSQALVGHSDADVALHALTDAILGALADGDIGSHFPPSDPTWRGAESARFLQHAGTLVTARGGRLLHCDVTLICEAPKISPHRPAMRQRVADILGLAVERISVKATTTEKLGFTGRGEGIAAQATATLELPPGP